ncbi:hypothetical protein [Variovorax sp. IB41]|uniref:hypothetical protein n=1 Tax=Variovorax sp. IB41 TaxID=2779370 RepID=UPI0018E7207B|nr:hypothetical protein [Variovorax sp. IB41]MBJ2158728.1 hypothetical protein [Variovorax sp. IB41]
MHGTLHRCCIALIAGCMVAGSALGASKARRGDTLTAPCKELPIGKSLAVQYHPTDGSTYLVAQVWVSVADAERGLRASAKKRMYGGPYAVGNVLIPQRGQFSMEDQIAIKERGATRRGDGFGASAYRELMQRPLDPGERQYMLAPDTTTNAGDGTLAYWQTASYTVNGKPATISSNFVVSLRALGPSKTELSVYQPRVKIFVGRRITMNAHTFTPYVDCREQSDDRTVPEDLDVVMQWARDAIHAAPPLGAN